MLLLTQTNADKQGKVSLFNGSLLGRIALVVVMAWTVGWLLSRSTQSIDRGHDPAGFPQGMLHGAMMPCAMPNLLMGRDVSIYAQNNSGIRYKLGYTVGVNACGAIFFGLFFLRLQRWRRRLAPKVTLGYEVASPSKP